MGTDIHMHVEMFEKWDEPPRWKLVMTEEAAYGARSYNTFAVLANVRNGYGFAGVDTGDGFRPIAMPRGIPSDVSPELAKIVAEELEHTPSWLLLSEVLSYDWTQTARHRGIVTAKAYAEMKAAGLTKPVAWCGGVAGAKVVIVSRPEMDALLDAGVPKDGREYYTTVEWEETYETSCHAFLAWARRLVDESDVADSRLCYRGAAAIRLVFWFDS